MRCDREVMACIVRLGGGGMDRWVPGIRILHSIRPRWPMGLCVGDISKCRGIEVGYGTKFRQMIIDGGQIIEMRGMRCTKPCDLVSL